jgi:prephenate dehydratase
MPPSPPAEIGPRPRVAYLGPEGTFSEEALLRDVRPDTVEPVAHDSIYEAVMAVERGSAEFALAPIENSLEGSVTVTLDTLAGDDTDLAIVAETVLPVRHCLIGLPGSRLSDIRTVISHPHVPGQCTRFLRGELAEASVLAAGSTAEAVRQVAELEDRSRAAIGTRLAADLYGCEVLREGIEDHADNETRFVWLAARGSRAARPPLVVEPPTGAPFKTSLVFWGAGAGSPGWLVRCLDEFARREINLTKIESRPRRERSWRYMFFADMVGGADQGPVEQAIDGLRGLCEQVRVLGSYPVA